MDSKKEETRINPALVAQEEALIRQRLEQEADERARAEDEARRACLFPFILSLLILLINDDIMMMII